MKKFLFCFVAALFVFWTSTSVLAGYGLDFHLQPYTINSPVRTSQILEKIDLDAAVVDIHYGYVPGAELDFSVRYASGKRATYGFTAGGNYRHTTEYMPGRAQIGANYRLYSGFYDSHGKQGTSTGGRWAP